MTEEIKEILNYFRKYMSITDCIKLSKIEDYITNLQKENLKLINENEAIKNIKYTIDETIYKQRNEKAVEYIKQTGGYIENINRFRVDVYEPLCLDLLNILEGGDE